MTGSVGGRRFRVSKSNPNSSSLARLIDTLAESLPEYSLPASAIHAHTRHYMPTGGLDKGRPKTTLVFDAFVRLASGSTLIAAWPRVTLEPGPFALAADLARGIGYLGRAESWTECKALAEWDGAVNCRPLDANPSGDPVRLLAPLSPDAYSAERQRIMNDMKHRMLATAKRTPTKRRLDADLDKALRSKGRQEDDEPEPGSVKEWRLALEGFGKPADFAGSAHIFATSDRWRSVTPFLASGHLKASGYPGEVRRLLKRRGLDATDVQVSDLKTIDGGGNKRRAIHFHFRTRGREAQPDAAGALLSIVLPEAIEGPLAIGYGSHFGLGLFAAVEGDPPADSSGRMRRST